MRHTARRTAVLLGLAWLLAACTLQTNTVVKPGGDGELRTEIGLSLADQQVLRTVASSPEQFCRDMQTQAGLPGGAEILVEERGLEVWCVLSLPFDNLDRLAEMYAEIDGVTVHQLEIVDGTFYYDVNVQVLGASLAEFTTLVPGLSPDIRWQVTVPGRVLTHNAERAEGLTLYWSLITDEPLRAQATSQLSGGRPLFGQLDRTGWLVVLLLSLCFCGGLTAAAGVVAFVLIRRRRRRSAPQAAV